MHMHMCAILFDDCYTRLCACRMAIIDIDDAPHQTVEAAAVVFHVQKNTAFCILFHFIVSICSVVCLVDLKKKKNIRTQIVIVRHLC